MLISRRGFLAGLTAVLAAPAIVRVASIMPVKVQDDGWKWNDGDYDFVSYALGYAVTREEMDGRWYEELHRRRLERLMQPSHWRAA